MGSLSQRKSAPKVPFCGPLPHHVDFVGVIDSLGHTLPVSFGERLRELRDEKGLTQEQLAEAAGVSKGQVSRWERGEDANPGLVSIQQLADALGVQIADFFPRPEGETGHAAADTRPRERAEILDRLLDSIDGDFPAEDSVEGDIHKAIAALNRALRRGRTTGTTAGKAQKVGP